MAGHIPENEDQKFSHLVEGVVAEAQTETKCKTSDMLRDVIRIHIQMWLDKVQDINPLYKVSELIPVGSYAEGTKILQPDEFDYLAVIEEFSKSDMVGIDENGSNTQQGLVHLVVINEELKSKCSELCKDGRLKCFQPINYAKPEEKRFGHVLIQTLWTIVKRSKQQELATGTPTEIDCKILLPNVYNIPIYLKGAEFGAPNVLIKFEYKDLEVTVDVSPAIRYHKIQDCFSDKDCAGPAFSELVHRRKSLLFVGTDLKSDFKVTVTEAEVEYIKAIMKPEHKITYIFLKYIVNLYGKLTRLLFSFTSYMMKTVCIHHDINCEKEERSIKECFRSILEDLNVCTQQGYVVSIVNRHIRLRKGLEQKSDREFLLHGMEKMCELPSYITTVEDFDEFVKQIICDEGKKRTIAKKEEEKKNTEYRESILAELQERVSKIVAMGFEREEAQEVMTRYMYDSEQAIGILKKREWKREEEKLNQKNHENLVHDSQTRFVIEDCDSKSGPEKPSKLAELYQDHKKYSEKNRMALNSPQKLVTEEILYQRQKDV